MVYALSRAAEVQGPKARNMAEFNTVFTTEATDDSTDEAYDVKVEYGVDHNGDSFDDIRVTITQTSGTNSGTEDILGVAFDLNSLPAGTVIDTADVTKGLKPGETNSGATVSTFDTTSGIDPGNVSDDGPTNPGFNTSGGTTQEPYDAFVKVSESGSGEGIVQTFTFIISNPTQDLDGIAVLSNTDWWIRASSTDGGEGSAKTADVVGEIVICFAPGTRIATPAGNCAVEDLQIGDPVLTTDGRKVPVKWLGRKTVHKLRAGSKMEPVRIRAGALSNGVPHTDLVVTGDHGMIIDELVVNASALVNGTKIDWVPLADLPDEVTYYHVETEAHDEILANGAPAETFVDYLDRQNFDNHQEYLDRYGCERLIPEMNRTRVSCQRLLPRHLRERFSIPSPQDSDQDRHALGSGLR